MGNKAQPGHPPMMQQIGTANAPKGIDKNPNAVPKLPTPGMTIPNQASMSYLNALKGPRTNISLPH